jgi:hypothetical protein
MAAGRYAGAIGGSGKRSGVGPGIGLEKLLAGAAGGKQQQENKRVARYHAGRKARLDSLNGNKDELLAMVVFQPLFI